MHHRRAHLRRRGEGLGGQLHDDARRAAPLGQHRQPPVGPGAGTRGDALGHFALEHQGEAFPERRPFGRGQPAHQKLGADVVRQVGDHPDRRGEVRQRVQLQRVGMHHLQPARTGGGDLGQRRQAAGVLLHRQNPARPLGQQPAGKPAGPGAHLEHVAGGKIARLAGDLGGEVEVEQEVLPQRLARREPVRRDHLAQRRQPVYGRHRRSSPLFFCAQILPPEA